MSKGARQYFLPLLALFALPPSLSFSIPLAPETKALDASTFFNLI
jgi:hypothetical protein